MGEGEEKVLVFKEDHIPVLEERVSRYVSLESMHND